MHTQKNGDYLRSEINLINNSGNYFIMYLYKVIMLYTLNIYTFICQLYFNNEEEKFLNNFENNNNF